MFQAACHIPKADPELFDDESFVPPEDPSSSIPGGQYFDEMHWGNEYTAGELHGDSCWLDAVPEDTDVDEADWLFDRGSTALKPDCDLDATESTDSDSLLVQSKNQTVMRCILTDRVPDSRGQSSRCSCPVHGFLRRPGCRRVPERYPLLCNALFPSPRTMDDA